MYNWVTTRKIARTDAPNYPARAAQTVDLVVAKWIPTFAALLACSFTPSRPKLDVRQYDWQPEFTWVRPVVDATVRTYIPATQTELQSYATRARPSLDVRRYEWAPESIDIVTRVDAQVRTWGPAFKAELVSERVRERPPLDVRRYEWAPGAFDIVTRVDAQVRTWIPAFDAELSSRRTDGRGLLDVRRYDWEAPESGWLDGVLNPPATVAETWPAFQQTGLSARTANGPRLDVRTYDWAPQFVDPVTLPTVPGGGSGPSGATGTNSWFLRRVYERTTGPQQVYTATLPVATTAQVWPAILQASGLSYRTSARSSLDVRLYDWDSNESAWIQATQAPPPTVAQTAPAWTSQAQSFRTAKGPTVDLFRAQSIPDIFGVPDDWITWVPLQDTGGRTRERARLDVRRYEWIQPAWIYTSIPVVATDAQTWPAILEAAGLSYRTRARSLLDVRTYDWAPIFSWAQFAVDAAIGKLAPIFSSELACFRTPPDPRLDVRTHDWQPAFTWPSRVVDAVVAKWIPVFDAQWSPVTKDRARLDVRSLTDTSGPMWVFKSLPLGDAAAQVIIRVEASPFTITVTADPFTIVVPPDPEVEIT